MCEVYAIMKLMCRAEKGCGKDAVLKVWITKVW